MTQTHIPVLAGELIELTDPRPGEIVVDCTFGGGGHARLIAERIGPAGTLIGIDRDPLAEERFAELAAEVTCHTRFIRADFASGLERLTGEQLTADLIYLDLGMSSMQVDTWERGFSYAYDAPLDMRMDPDQDLTAHEIVNEWDERRLARLLREYGEERYATQIARAINRARGREELTSTQQLVETIKSAMPDPGPVRGRSSRAPHLPGAADRRQRRTEPARGGAPRRVGAASAGRATRRDLVSLSRRPAREAISRRARPGLHLSAGPSDLCVRP